MEKVACPSGRGISRWLIDFPRSLATIGSPSGPVAQLVEQRTENPRVGGSIPPWATI